MNGIHGLAKDWTISTSNNCWTNEELGYEWLTEVFIPKTKPHGANERRFLLLDGHSSHVSPQFIRACKQNQIEALLLPPRTTHLIQHLDAGVFSPYAVAYKKEVDS